MRRILITGGSGFIGTNLVDHYLARGHSVLNLDIAQPRSYSSCSAWKRIDICNEANLRSEIKQFSPDFVFHLAARTDLNGKTLADYRANTTGVQSLANAVSSAPNLERIVFASSMLIAELGYIPKHDTDYRPSTLYGESKVIGETFLRSEVGVGLPWVIVRPTSIWGPWFDVPYRGLFNAIARGIYFHPRGIEVNRSYGYVLNSVFQLDRLAQAARSMAEHRTFYLADYEPIDLRTWTNSIQNAFGAPRIRELPLSVLKLGAAVGDTLKAFGMLSPPLTTFRLNNMLTSAAFDLRPLQAVCGSTPFTLHDGVRTTVEWLKGQRVS
jgi:nucleoside-diphosphate-sugar epimerase